MSSPERRVGSPEGSDGADRSAGSAAHGGTESAPRSEPRPSESGPDSKRPRIGMDVAREKDEEAERRRRLLRYGGAVAVVVAVVAVLFALDPAAPSVDRPSVLIGTVERGTLVRRVRGTGTLVPERMRVVSALTAGRVERVRVEPGQEAADTTILLELSNPDVELEVLDAQRQLTAARASLASLRERLGTRVLEQRAAVATARAEWLDARRQAEADSVLVARELLPRNDARRSMEGAEAAATRLEVEERTLELLQRTRDEQIAVQREQVERLEATLAHRRRRVESMRVTAGASGVVQDVDLQPGEWVQPGQMLARVAEPDRLEAELRISQTQAREVRPGQPALVDLRADTVQGRVRRVDPNVQDGTVLVEVELEGPLPSAARPDLTVDGYVTIQRLEDVLHVGRPAFAQAGADASVYRLDPGGDAAVRVPVRFGAGSVDRIQVLEGLEEGDRIVVSDLSRFEDEDRIRIE